MNWTWRMRLTYVSPKLFGWLLEPQVRRLVMDVKHLRNWAADRLPRR